MSVPTTHVIFDLDGTIVNAVDVIRNILEEYAKSVGKTLVPEISAKIENINDLPGFFSQYFDSISLEGDIEFKKKLMEQLIQKFFRSDFNFIPGVERLIKHLHSEGIPMAIATGNSNRHFAIISSKFPQFFDKYFSHVVRAYDDPEVKVRKPNPKVYAVCAQRFESKPKDLQNILVIEDSLTGIIGAVDSGMKTLLINDQKVCNFDEVKDKITLICKSFDDFKPESVGLPPYKTQSA